MATHDVRDRLQPSLLDRLTDLDPGSRVESEDSRIMNKAQIRAAVEQLFGVKVTGVWTSHQRGKDKRVGKTVGRRPNWKKAIITLAEGDSIEIFEG